MKQWEHMLDVWYETVGYDRKTGKPKKETLQALGLDWLARELWRASRSQRRGERISNEFPSGARAGPDGHIPQPKARRQ